MSDNETKSIHIIYEIEFIYENYIILKQQTHSSSKVNVLNSVQTSYSLQVLAKMIHAENLSPRLILQTDRRLILMLAGLKTNRQSGPVHKSYGIKDDGKKFQSLPWPWTSHHYGSRCSTSHLRTRKLRVGFVLIYFFRSLIFFLN